MYVHVCVMLSVWQMVREFPIGTRIPNVYALYLHTHVHVYVAERGKLCNYLVLHVHENFSW